MPISLSYTTALTRGLKGPPHMWRTSASPTSCTARETEVALTASGPQSSTDERAKGGGGERRAERVAAGSPRAANTSCSHRGVAVGGVCSTASGMLSCAHTPHGHTDTFRSGLLGSFVWYRSWALPVPVSDGL